MEFLQQPTKILYVEDNALSLRLLERAFRKTSYTLIGAVDGYSGIETALKEQPALILLDLMLPDIDGIEVAQVLKNETILRHVPIVALTSDSKTSTRQRCMEVGFSAYLTKPLSRNLLLRTIRDTLYELRQVQ